MRRKAAKLEEKEYFFPHSNAKCWVKRMGELWKHGVLMWCPGLMVFDVTALDRETGSGEDTYVCWFFFSAWLSKWTVLDSLSSTAVWGKEVDVTHCYSAGLCPQIWMHDWSNSSRRGKYRCIFVNAEFSASFAFDCLVNISQPFFATRTLISEEMRPYSRCTFILVVCESSMVCFLVNIR